VCDGVIWIRIGKIYGFDEHGNKSANSIKDLELIHELVICQE
jgi:hypothetical protein